MKISLGAIFDEIPCTIVHGCWPNFGATLKIHKNPICLKLGQSAQV